MSIYRYLPMLDINFVSHLHPPPPANRKVEQHLIQLPQSHKKERSPQMQTRKNTFNLHMARYVECLPSRIIGKRFRILFAYVV